MNLLAFDTSTEVMSIAVSRTEVGTGGGTVSVWQHTGAGGAQASAHLIGEVMALLQQADVSLKALDAICFGAGPGSFTGLRTACAVAQGLAYGAGVPVLAVDSLLAVAEEARFQALAGQATCRITALLDARMDEMYAATWGWDGARWTELAQSALLRPEALQTQGAVLAGNVFGVYAGRLGAEHGGAESALQVTALPTAAAMLRVAPQMLASGLAVDAAQALPRYIRDKVAKTTAERYHEKALARDALAAKNTPASA